MKTFTEWLQNKVEENMGFSSHTTNAQPNIYQAVMTLRNHFANMQNNPMHWLGTGLKQAAELVHGNPDAESIISSMDNIAQRFIQNIRNHNLMISDRKLGGQVRMPYVNEPLYKQYEPLFQKANQDLHQLLQRLGALIQRNAA